MIVFFFVIIVFLTLVLGLLLAFAISSLDRAVVQNAQQAERQTKAYNPAATLGHKVPVQGDPDELLREARQLAAKQAAATPRGANMRIGQLRQESGRQPTAFDGVKEDPLTAVKIATVHGWDAVRMGMVHGSAPAAAPAAATTAAGPAAPAGPRELIPGKDYPVIEITDSMSPEEIRKARIANSKAKSAAMKAAKAAGDTGAAAPATAAPAAAAPTAAVPVQSAAAAAGVPEPQYIEIADSMSPDEVRKARIANSKMKSAYNKALKAAGVDPSALEEAAPVAPPPEAAAPTAPAPADPGLDAAALAAVPKPELIEITEDMSPDEVRKARIANSKATAAYKKALKAAGLDPAG